MNPNILTVLALTKAVRNDNLRFWLLSDVAFAFGDCTESWEAFAIALVELAELIALESGQGGAAA